jgi:hypothetical protein
VSDPDFEHLFEDCPGLPGGCPRCVEIFDNLASQPRQPRPLPDPDKTFTCPDCKAVSPNINDTKNSYCPNCHEFKHDDFTQLRCMEPTCPDFGSRDFGEGTCPQEHAVPPARRMERPQIQTSNYE